MKPAEKVYEHESTAEKRCGMVVNWTCNDDGDVNGDIECGATAEWVGLNDLLACSDCYHAHDEQDRATFRYLEAAHSSSDREPK